jgi:hypothetical protein
MNSYNRITTSIDKMNQLDSRKINCSQCDGHCCTYLSNSMQVTPIEAVELLHYLKSKGRWNEELKRKLNQCVQDYRLDKEISTGRNSTFRRTYTCPFYTPGPKGCSIAIEYKPYGCLAFNPKNKNADGTNCHSDIEVLEEREKLNTKFEIDKNAEITRELKLWWDKLPMPYALLEIDKNS